MDTREPDLRQVRVACECSGPHKACHRRRWLLRHQQPAVTVHVVSQQEEREGEGWYDWASWTWADYIDEINYITYET
jgi:hypothetical protein